MTRSRKVLLAIIALVVLADFLPVTRDEFSWWWAQSNDHSADYLRYLSNWPKGRHVVEAHLLAQHRQWDETKRALIRQAYAAASQTNADTDAVYRREQRLRRESFFWKQVSNADTIASYNEYLQRFPHGRYATAARQKIQALSRPAPETNAIPR